MWWLVNRSDGLSNFVVVESSERPPEPLAFGPFESHEAACAFNVQQPFSDALMIECTEKDAEMVADAMSRLMEQHLKALPQTTISADGVLMTRWQEG